MNSSFLRGALLAALLLGAAAAEAQNRLPPRRTGSAAPRPRVAAANGVGLKDGLMMQKSRVVLTELGISNPLVTTKKLINGTTISPTGVVTARDSSKVQMGEGDMVSLTGRITSRATIVEADSLLKIKTFDLKYPGKRKKMEKEAEEKAKAKAKRDKEKEKMKAKRK